MTAEAATAGRETLTFILPVLNRHECIVRAIESCLRCESNLVESQVIVIDGGSTDGTIELMQERYSNDSRVRIIRQPSDQPGFMAACYLGVEHVEGGLATFMYSDDVLSPWFVMLADALVLSKETDLALGYGQQSEDCHLIGFEQPRGLDMVEADRVLAAYYGRPDLLDAKPLPVSPVCCIVRAWVLRSWVRQLRSFIESTPLRRYAMIKLAGGQDLMIYLTALLHGQKNVMHCSEVVAQLTASETSITKAGNRETQLLVGYWLARAWGFYRAIEVGNKELAARCAGYIFVVWLFIFAKKIMRFDFAWFSAVIREMGLIISVVYGQGLMIKSFVESAACIRVRRRMMLGKS